MPNYCECHLRISDPDCELGIAPVLEAIAGKNGAIDFNNIIPYPTEFDALDEKRREWEKRVNEMTQADRAKVNWSERPRDGYNQGGYEWCLSNWGTKWNAGSIKVIDTGEFEAVLQFDTAWSPPTPVISKLSEMFPAYQFQLEYYEMGMQFCGSISWADGKIENQTEGKYYGWRGG